LDDLAQAHGRRQFTMREWMAAKKPIDERIADAERRLRRVRHADALHGLVGRGTQLRLQWTELNLDRQTSIVKAVLDHAVIKPGTQGSRVLDIDRVDPRWRL